MLKPFVVIFVANKIFGFMGPVEGDMSHCLTLVEQQTAVVERQIATGRDSMGNPITEEARQISFGCLYSKVTPYNTRPLAN